MESPWWGRAPPPASRDPRRRPHRQPRGRRQRSADRPGNDGANAVVRPPLARWRPRRQFLGVLAEL